MILQGGKGGYSFFFLIFPLQECQMLLIVMYFPVFFVHVYFLRGTVTFKSSVPYISIVKCLSIQKGSISINNRLLKDVYLDNCIA